ncbi:MAG: MFS transporter [Rhodobacteraceae bacterium]|nr:MFS transporter [Paracoccaceae bacterium]
MAPHSDSSQLSPFRYRIFATIWGASLISNLGTQLQQVGAGWLMTSLTTSPDKVALVQSAVALPVMLFALVAGALADNIDRRRLMLTAQGFMLVTALALTALAWAGLLTPWSLLGLTFLLGAGQALNNPAWQASVGDMVPRAELPQAVVLNSIGFNIARSIGPAIGGLIVAAAGAAVAFAMNAASFLVMLGTLVSWRTEPRKAALPREEIWRAVVDGVAYVAMSPNLLRVLLRAFLFGFGAVALLALLPVVARHMLDAGPLSYGLMLGAFGMGAILGGLLNPRLAAVLSGEGRARAGFVLFGLALVWLAVSRDLWVSAPALALAGASWVLTLSLFNVMVQLSTPRWVVGRAISLYQTAVFGGMALGSWTWGGAAARFGVPAALAIAAATLAVGALVGLARRLPEPGLIDLDPLDRFREPELQLDLRLRSGPIAVTVEYEIRQEDVAEFLANMAVRRRIRVRDGARRWALLRDLENPRLWSESYHVATWTEYLRHNMRRTRADADNLDHLRALHQGEGHPKVHRMIERPTVPRHDDMPLRSVSELAP